MLIINKMNVHFHGNSPQFETLGKFLFILQIKFMEYSCLIRDLLFLVEACGTIAVYQGPQKEPDDYSNFVIEDSVTTFKTIQQIKSIIEKLDEPHEKYRKKRSSSAKYGSK